MKQHADIVAQKLNQLFDAKKRALEEGDEAIAQQIGGGKDLMSIFCVSSFPWTSRGYSYATVQ